MNIEVEILDSEKTTTGGGSPIRRPKQSKKSDGRLIGMYENSVGTLYGLVVLPDGFIKKVQADHIKVTDRQYI